MAMQSWQAELSPERLASLCRLAGPINYHGIRIWPQEETGLLPVRLGKPNRERAGRTDSRKSSRTVPTVTKVAGLGGLSAKNGWAAIRVLLFGGQMRSKTASLSRPIRR